MYGSNNSPETEFYAATSFITLLDPTKLSSAMTGTLKLSNPSKLKYLELSDCLASEIVLQELLRSCCSLQKLSLKGMVIRVVNFSNWGYKIRKIFA